MRRRQSLGFYKISLWMMRRTTLAFTTLALSSSAVATGKREENDLQTLFVLFDWFVFLDGLGFFLLYRRLNAYPRTYSTGDDYLSVYLELLPGSSPPPGRMKHVKFTITLVNSGYGKFDHVAGDCFSYLGLRISFLGL